MATTPPLPAEMPAMALGASDAHDNDPFRPAGPTHHRFSNFNAQLFALGPNASPAQAKRALEAHLAETDRRMEEAGKLGTALVHQRNELTERLREVEKLQAEDELSDDLRHKLAEIEKDYHEVARESARAFLPKSRVPSNEAAVGSPFVPEGKGGKRSVSPSKFEAQATASPTKLNVPNRKIRNQPSNRIHDIEFAAEISTSLIAQVRNLQGLLAEKDEELKDLRSENSKLEYEVEGFQQRLKTLDDSEHRYKDENWNLETQVHELMAKEREAADREKKLTQALNLLQSEKNAGQRELDEIKLTHSKLVEEHAAAVKHHDIELGTAKRSMVMAESERAALQKKIDDLAGRNTELAQAMSLSIRAKKTERESIVGMSDEDFQTAHDNTTPEQSPPASPVKGTPRHSMLESETLKTSLAHAQRLIQSLRSNVHREKTEKIESRRLLQEARDEIERLRGEPMVPNNKRARKTDSKEFKKPPRLLGGLRSARSEIFTEDTNWEDQPDMLPHPRSSPISRETTMLYDPVPEHTDHFETANETSDAAFETANENATETDDFHTGAEEFSSDDVETETESPSKRRTLTGRPPNLLMHRSHSIDSTASTEDEDFPYEDMKTPTHLPPLQAKFPLRVSRGAFRRSRNASEEPALLSSPASFANSSNMGTPQQPAQSLAAELGDFDGSDNESAMSATPSRRSVRGRAITPPPALPPLPRVIMVDSGMMTEPVHELPGSVRVRGAVNPDRPMSMATVMSRFSMGSDYSDSVTHDLGEKLAEFPTPPTSSPMREHALPPSLVLSTVHSHDVEPLPEPDTRGAEMAALSMKHEEELEKLRADNALAHATAIEALNSEHHNELTAVKQAHAQELEGLRSDHSDSTKIAIADIQAAHAREIESIKSSHADDTSKAAADAQALYERDLEALKTRHTEQLAQRESEKTATLAIELAALRASHAQELSRREYEITAAHSADVEALKTSHNEEISRKESERVALYAADTEALKATHVEELARQESELKATHATEIEALKTAHVEEISQKESELKAAALAEVEAVRLTHTEELSKFKEERDAAHATEMAALAASHSNEIDAAKKELSAVHDKEFEDLKSSYANQADQAKQSMDAAQAEELERLKASHLQHIEDMRASINATHAEELESLKVAHAQQIADVETKLTAAQTAVIASLTESHNKQLDDAKNILHELHSQELASLKDLHSQELGSLKATHIGQIDTFGKEKDTAHAAAIDALIKSHDQEIGELKNTLSATHLQEIERLSASHAEKLDELRKERDTAHIAALAVLTATHAKELETQKSDSETILANEIVALKATHAQEIEGLNSQHAAAHAKELEVFEAALAKQVESSKTEGDVAHNQTIEALNAAHSEIIEAHKRDAEIAQSQALDALKSSHELQLETLKTEHITTRNTELELLTSKHLAELSDLKAANATANAEELEALTTKHLNGLKGLKDEHEAARLQLREELSSVRLTELEALRQDLEATHSKERELLRQDIESLNAKHAEDLEALKSEHQATIQLQLQELTDNHSRKIASLHEEDGQSRSKELAALSASHAQILETLKGEHETNLARKVQEIVDSHARELEELRQQTQVDHSRELSALATGYQSEMERAKKEFESVRQKELADLQFAHAATLTSLRAEHQATLEQGLSGLKAKHSEAIEAAKRERDNGASEALQALEVSHAQQLDQLKKESNATLSRELDVLKAQHVQMLNSQAEESNVRRHREIEVLRLQHAQSSQVALNQLRDTLTSQYRQTLQSELQILRDTHAAELEALRASLAKAQPTLGYSSMSSIETEPIEELPELKSPRREAFIIPRDGEPRTPQSYGFTKQSRASEVPIIAEDDTRQSPSAVRPETPDSQQPFKEITTNTDARPFRKLATSSSHQSSQTLLTAEGLDLLLKNQGRDPATTDVPADEAMAATPSTVRIRRSSTDSVGSVVRAKPSSAASEHFPSRRPGSRSSAQDRPPLPENHREVIEAARTGSAHGRKGSMGPPLYPASAYRPSSRPQTPSNKRPMSPASVVKGTPTPRAGKTPGHADVHSPVKMPARSRQSSISSFASEIDTRFNIHNGMGMGPSGFGPNTDPRMIQAVTQTMIGEYLWKYTRKTGRGEMSENRHRRFFWVHPYTRALYWSDGDPAAGNRGEMKAKSVPIEAVRVVADDNPMPPGLHRKSLVVIARGRTIKFTCTTGQRHETWFNALSYLLLRSSDENKQDAEEVAGNITQEDVDEFNPPMHRRAANGQRPQAPPSLSSYNSRTTRNDSPNLDVSMSIPTLTPTHEREVVTRSGTLGRLSGYWKSSNLSRGTFSSLRSRSYQPDNNAIYEASEVPDSAEDVRRIIEQQDRESDRLENVRACCDGKHDVGTLSHTLKRGRIPTSFQSHSHPQSVAGSVRSRT
ncbi:hypothetical protein F5B22DRAFT_559911 [Xylaria bambusicola]|uniref:uncharacterized protein n=1 Tax=Xylaria bambusicola TaxID=326684 RepID=UPI0020075F5D|nr:uncharacterized protein F5B22DRAFT_559911 [Xylaria bambusicola]KAI0503204.1 hypothetical protein F5B22DRAFT_559911 [Xylaria bambusicola]